MSMKDLRKRSSEALSRVAAERSSAQAEEGKVAVDAPAPMRAITATGARALMQPTIDALSERAEAAEQAAASARDALAQAQARLAENPLELELERIVEVPGRRRRLSPEEFAELRGNLEHNELVHPVVVRLLPGQVDAGGKPMYELISGYNRLDVFRILGRRAIPVRVMAVEDEGVDGAAFWSNLLQPSLPDYEKFLGLKQYRDRHKLSDAEVSRRAGISKTHTSFLMSFDQLPAVAKEALDANPKLMGAAAARRFVKASQAGTDISEAVGLLSTGEITQEAALRIVEDGASARSISPGRKVLASTVQIRSGQFDLCRMVAKGSSLRLEFKLEAHRERAQAIVEQAMEELAIKLSSLDESRPTDA